MPNEIATGLSHVAAVREGLSLGTEFFCILEDDTIPAPRLAECLDETVLRALPPFEALRLFAHFDRWEKPSKTIATLAGSVVVRMLRDARAKSIPRQAVKKLFHQCALSLRPLILPCITTV